MKKVMCKNDHRMIPVVPDLLVCECSSYGRLADLKGAVEEARQVVEKAGGVEVLRDRVEKEEAKQKEAAKLRGFERKQSMTAGVRPK